MSKSPLSTITAITKLGAAPAAGVVAGAARALRLGFALQAGSPAYRLKLGQKTLFHLLAGEEPLPGYAWPSAGGYEVVFWRRAVGDDAFAALSALPVGHDFGHSHGQGKMVYIATSYQASYHLVAIDQGIAALGALMQDARFASVTMAATLYQTSASETGASGTGASGNDSTITAADLQAAYGPLPALTIKPLPSEDAMAAELCAAVKGAKGPCLLAGDGKRLGQLKKRLVMMGVYEDHIPIETTHNPLPRFKVDKSALKEGLTTGACSTAAAKAATLLATGAKADLNEVTSRLPMGRDQVFALFRKSPVEGGFAVSIIKDAGDDPDVTHGAEITATVTLAKQPGVNLVNGKGVAKVTKPGLGLTVGGPAINPVPRQTITEQVQAVLDDSADYSGATVTISIEDGEDRAKNTTNARLGLLGGLSILGTTGVVKPYSTAAFVASVTQSIKLAGHDGHKELVFTTGGRSEQFAMKLLPHIAESCFIQVGDYIGVALRNSVAVSMTTVYIVAMIGKLSKMADGRMMTHASGSEVNMQLLADLATRSGASASAHQQILQANTARHVLDICTAEGMAPQLCTTICSEVKAITENFSKNKVTINVVMVDFVGKVIAKFPPDITLNTQKKAKG